MSTPKRTLEIIIPKHCIEGDVILIQIDDDLSITASSPIVPRRWKNGKHPSGWAEGKLEKVSYTLIPFAHADLSEAVKQVVTEDAKALVNRFSGREKFPVPKSM